MSFLKNHPNKITNKKNSYKEPPERRKALRESAKWLISKVRHTEEILPIERSPPVRTDLKLNWTLLEIFAD